MDNPARPEGLKEEKMSTIRFNRLFVLALFPLFLCSNGIGAQPPTIPWEPVSVCANLGASDDSIGIGACAEYALPSKPDDDGASPASLALAAAPQTEAAEHKEDLSRKQIYTFRLEYGRVEIDDPARAGANVNLDVQYWRLSFRHAPLRRKDRVDRIYVGGGAGLYDLGVTEWGFHLSVSSLIQLTPDPRLNFEMALVYNWLDSGTEFADWRAGLVYKIPKRN